MSSNDFDFKFKIVIIGDTMVGKSCILRRYSDNTFSLFHLNTIGIDFLVKNLIYDEKKIKLQLWDTAGQERFKAISSSYYKGSDGVIFAYDITSSQSFTQTNNWIDTFNLQNDEYTVKVLIGNKNDLEAEREVSTETGKRLAAQYNMDFFETSALNNCNINEMFECLVNKIYEKAKFWSKEANKKLEDAQMAKEWKCC